MGNRERREEKTFTFKLNAKRVWIYNMGSFFIWTGCGLTEWVLV